MKALRLAVAVTAVLFASIYAVADDVMRITYKDGTTAQFKVSDIEDMSFESLIIPESIDHEAVDLARIQRSSVRSDPPQACRRKNGLLPYLWTRRKRSQTSDSIKKVNITRDL